MCQQRPTLKISSEYLESIREKGLSSFDEIGGIFSSNIQDTFEVANIFHIHNAGEGWDYIPSPNLFMKTLKIINASGNEKYTGFFHSHPRGVAIPSMFDVNRSKKMDPDTIWLIFSGSQNNFRAWKWDKNQEHFYEISINGDPIDEDLYIGHVSEEVQLADKNWSLI